jgi:hypothetical protein
MGELYLYGAEQGRRITDYERKKRYNRVLINTGEYMIRFLMMGLIAAAVFSGCTTTEFNQGVNDGVSDVKRVIRGDNN